MSTPEPLTAITPATPRQRRVAVIWWFVAGAVYTVFGMLLPWAFLLGFWQSAIFVAVVTALTPRIVRRFS